MKTTLVAALVLAAITLLTCCYAQYEYDDDAGDYEDDFLSQLRQDYELSRAARLGHHGGGRAIDYDGGPPFGRGADGSELYIDEVYDDDNRGDD